MTKNGEPGLSKNQLEEILESMDVEQWNRLRQEFPTWKPDLSGVFLYGCSLEGINFESANLTGFSLGRGYLGNANLRDTNLREADLERTNLEYTSLIGADLTEADLIDVDWIGANLENAKILKTKFTSQRALDILAVPLSKDQIRGAIFRDPNLSQDDVFKLLTSDIKAWNKIRFEFLNWQPNLSGMNFSHCDLREANLSRAYLRNADLSYCHLDGANLEDTILEEADLSRAILSSTNLRGAVLTNALLTEAVLMNGRGLRQEQLESIRDATGLKHNFQVNLPGQLPYVSLPEANLQKVENHLIDIKETLDLEFGNIKLGLATLYQYINRTNRLQLEQILETMRNGAIEQGEMIRTLDAIRRALLAMQKNNTELKSEVQSFITKATTVIESKLTLQQKLELTLPILPYFLDYKVEFGAGSDADINSTITEIKERWLSLVTLTKK